MLAQASAEIKKELKSNFPQTKFSVKSSRGGMSNAVYVEYTDGPSSLDVQKLLSKYEASEQTDYVLITRNETKA